MRRYSLFASALALLGYVMTASAGSYWLDGGEMVSATIALDIIHPPGHPLTSLWGKAFTLLPFGALAFRVALGQAVAAAIGIGFFCSALGRLGEAFELPLSIRGPLAVGASSLVAFCFGLWFQAVRPEVYALQAMLLMIALERLSALVADDFRDGRPLFAACIAVGLGLTNHHLMAFFFFPPLAYAAVRLALRRARVEGGVDVKRALAPLAICAALGAMCLLVYLYLPLRALTDLPLNLGTPITLERIYWVVSAKVYARQMGGENPQPIDERYLDVVVVLVEQFGWTLVVLATCGAYIVLRVARARSIGVLWLLTGGSVLLVRPWLGPVRGNPDSVGYLIAGLCAVAALAMALVCTTFALWRDARAGALPARMAAIGISLIALCVQVTTQARASSLAGFHATDAFDDLRYRELPPRSVVIATTPQTVFRHVELHSAERTRPDVALIALPFLRYPGVADTAIRRVPGAATLVRRFMASDALDPRALVQLARAQPVFVELDTSHVAPAEYVVLAPAGPFFRVLDKPTTRRPWPELIAAQEHAQAKLQRAVPAQDVEAMRQLLWMRYVDALYYAALGQKPAALRSLAAGEKLYPADVHLLAMQQALARDRSSGRIDVRPFLRVDSLVPQAQ